MSDRFPILDGGGSIFGKPFVKDIPWSLAEAAHVGYTLPHRQSLERMGERGGMGSSEVVKYLTDAIDAGLVVVLLAEDTE